MANETAIPSDADLDTALVTLNRWLNDACDFDNAADQKAYLAFKTLSATLKTLRPGIAQVRFPTQSK